MVLRTLSILLALAVVSCGESTPATVCVSGSDIACRCDDGALGAATCSADGSSFGACACTGQPGSGGALSSSASSGSGGSGACSNDLSNIGTDDFRISLELATTQGGQVAVVNQRDLCQQEMFWDLRLSNGLLEMETSDSTAGGDYVASMSSMSVNDGAPHHIVVTRVGQELSIDVDGSPAGGGASPASFGALPRLAEGVDVCDDGSTFLPLSGTLKNVCVTSP